MDLEIIDFHVHPFLSNRTNICAHRDFCSMSAENTLELLQGLGISRICGSVISTDAPADGNYWDKLRANNDEALALQQLYGGFYIPGFHVHPGYPEESIAEIRRMYSKGVRLVGELVPYMDGWKDYASEAFSALLDEIGKHDMIVSFHSTGEDDAMDEMVKRHKNVIFVAAHPGEYSSFMRHIDRMKLSDNYYLDLSGNGLHRHGMVRRAIDSFGADRLLFGTDYPTCNPAVYVGGILLDPLLSDCEKEKILSGNAKRLLQLA